MYCYADGFEQWFVGRRARRFRWRALRFEWGRYYYCGEHSEWLWDRQQQEGK